MGRPNAVHQPPFFNQPSIWSARLAASSIPTQPFPSSTPSANAYKQLNTVLALIGTSFCKPVQSHAISSTLSVSKRWSWMVTGSSYAAACREIPEGETSRTSPFSKLMRQSSDGVPGNGCPRRNWKNKDAFSAAYLDWRRPRAI